MDHEFHVGETCRNRFGQYTVLEIRPPKMRIRYENGAEQMVDIAVQASIWERQHMERASPEGDGKESSKTKSVAKRTTVHNLPRIGGKRLQEQCYGNNLEKSREIGGPSRERPYCSESQQVRLILHLPAALVFRLLTGILDEQAT